MALADRDACLGAAPNKLAPLAATPLWGALERLVERRKPKLVILDALADLFGGEENARRHVRGFIVLLKRLAIRHKLAVVLIAHPSLAGMNSGSGPPRMSIPEALALMGEPRTPLDRHIRFTAETIADFFTAFSAVNRRCDLLQAEIDRLAAEVASLKEQRGPSESEGATLQ